MAYQQRPRAAASNAFTAEIGLLSSLALPRVSARQEAAAGMPAPKPIKKGTYLSVPPLNERQLATGEVQSLPNYGKLTLPASSTGHAGIKEMQISRKSRHESEIEAYNLRRTGLEVDLEARTGRAGRDFRKLLSLNDEELEAVFNELVDDFLLNMELDEVSSCGCGKRGKESSPMVGRGLKLLSFVPLSIEVMRRNRAASVRGRVGTGRTDLGELAPVWAAAVHLHVASLGLLHSPQPPAAWPLGRQAHVQPQPSFLPTSRALMPRAAIAAQVDDAWGRIREQGGPRMCNLNLPPFITLARTHSVLRRVLLPISRALTPRAPPCVVQVDDAWGRIQEQGVRRDDWTTCFEKDLEAIEQERRGLADAEMSKLTDALLGAQMPPRGNSNGGRETAAPTARRDSPIKPPPDPSSSDARTPLYPPFFSDTRFPVPIPSGIAHMLPADVEHLLETMSHEINLLILANREVHARLCAKLRLREVERKAEHRKRWEGRMQAWRQLRHAHALGCFILRLHQPHTVAPPERAATLAALSRQQADFQTRREEMMRSLAAIEPPDLTAASATDVSAQLDALAAEEAETEATRLSEFRSAEDNIEEMQREALEFLRGRLLHFSAVDPPTVDALLAAEVEPLLLRRRNEALDVIASTAAALRRQRRRLHEHALCLAGDFIWAGQIFDVHTAETALVYEAFRDDVAAVRARSEVEDQQREAALDTCLMRMRRAADQTELHGEAQAAMGLLNDIQHGYRSMQAEAVGIVQQHRGNVDGVLAGLQARICSSLDLRPRAEYAARMGAANAASGGVAAAGRAGDTGVGGLEGGDGEEGDVDAGDNGGLGGGTKRFGGEEEDLEATFGFVYPEKMRAEELLEDELAGLEPREEAEEKKENRMLVTTAGGVEWQMLTPEEREAASESEEHGASSHVPGAEANVQPLSETARAERASLVLEGGKLGLSVLLAPSDLSLRLRLGLAARCLSYHEAHTEAMRTRAADEADEVTAQLTLELDERLMAHQPRPGRVSTEMMAERDGELLAHRERFVRHVKAMRTRRAQVGRAGEAAMVAWRAAEAEHLAAIDKLSAGVRLEKNVHAPTLLRLQREAAAAHATYTAALQGRREALAGSTDGTLSALREFDATFAATWHDFDVGGSFHTVERDRFLERLDEQTKEAEAEAAAAGEKAAELFEAQLARAEEAMGAFRAVLELNMEDVKMLEGLRLRQGQASADMRLVSTASAAQQAAIDTAIARAGSLLSSLAGGGNAAMEAGTAAGAGGAALSAEAAAAVGECGGGPALDAMWSLDALRVMVMQRARLLEVLGSSTVPKSLPAISLEPLREGEAAPQPPAAPAPMPGSGVLAEGTLRAAIDAVRTRHEAGLLTYVQEYYTAKGERSISRPSLIPASMDEFRLKVGAMLAEMVDKAQADRVEATIAFRQQLASLKHTLAHFGPAVFETVAAGCRAAAAHAAASIEASDAPVAAELLHRRESHRLALKPALRNPANKAQRLALEQAEAERHEAAIAAATELRAALRASEQRHADALLRRLPHTAAVVLGLLDGTLQPEDISEAEAPPPPDRHYGIFKQMRIQARQEAIAASEDPPMAGRPFKAHTWPGIPLRELVAPVEEGQASSTAGEQPGVAPSAPGAEAGKEGAKAGKEGAQAGKEGAKAGNEGTKTGKEATKAGKEGAKAGKEGVKAGKVGGQAGKEGAEAGTEGGEEVSPPLTGCLARPQRLAMAARDRVYTSYRMHFEEQLQAIAKAADETIRAQRLWAANFTKQMVMLRNEE